jgi:DNA-binding MarR family transcriptional regulator
MSDVEVPDTQQDPPLFELFELAPRLNRLLDTGFKQLEPSLTFGQYRTLRRVGEGYRTLTAIHQVGTLSLPALSQRIEGLARKGLIRRRLNRNDRRSATLSLSDEGRRILREGEDLLVQLSNRLLRDMSGEDAQAIASAHAVAVAVAKALGNGPEARRLPTPL